MSKNVLERAVEVGLRDRDIFDWPNVEGAFNKVKEEIEELDEVLKSQNQTKIFEEFSDVFFTLLQVARHQKIDPEKNLDFALKKYNLRYHKMFQLIEEEKKQIEKLNLGELELFWQKAKKESHDELQKILASYL